MTWLVRRNLRDLIATVGLFLAACGDQPGTGTARPVESGTTRPPECVDLTGSDTARLTMTDNSFAPACFTVSTDQSLTIRNDGVSLHNLSVDFRKALTGTDLDIDVSAGETAMTEPVGKTLEPGDYRVFCKYHLPTMVAEMEVR